MGLRSTNINTTKQSSYATTTTATTTHDSIKYITIDNPTKRNALSLHVLQDLHSQFEHLKKSQTTTITDGSSSSSQTTPLTLLRPKVIILQSHGPVFCSGHDLKEIQANKNLTFRNEVFHLCTSIMNLIRQLDQPVIAKVQGLATAAGCQLVAACDLAIAAENSQFATPGVKIGLFCTTPGVALSRVVSQKKAMEMLLTGQPISAQEALQYGLVNRVVPADQLDQVTLSTAQHIANASSETIALGKRAFYRHVEMNKMEDAYSFGCKVMLDNLNMDDCIEGIDAFVQKRPPQWKH